MAGGGAGNGEWKHGRWRAEAAALGAGRSRGEAAMKLRPTAMELPHGGHGAWTAAMAEGLTSYFPSFHSPGMMLLQYSRAGGYIPLEILSIEDGKRLMSFKHLLHDNKKVDFIEQFNEKLLIKQEGENLQILDLRDFKVTEVSKAEFVSPAAFIFLYERHLFLTFNFRSVLVREMFKVALLLLLLLLLVRNFRGELVTSFEDHLLWNPDCNANNTYITSNQDLIISYCRDESFSDNNGNVQ
ncbi:hypothetical protein PR202_ga09253 [Eleusine coracana subsp. coracana]|uniref:Uncharacterized protein n=1 Tax=Eleusine coracana subsp. coracana TaxID=191504 RepID=A0AAV5C2C3_ELECO|nr:hypothetical protein PR202_ga09253 [Eleusine coracana subsp. coracana]